MNDSKLSLTLEIKDGSSKVFALTLTGIANLGANELHSANPHHAFTSLFKRALRGLQQQLPFDEEGAARVWQLKESIQELEPTFDLDRSQLFHSRVRDVAAELERHLAYVHASAQKRAEREQKRLAKRGLLPENRPE